MYDGKTLLLSFMISALPFHHHSQTATARFEIPAWKIGMTRDKFTDLRRCRLYQGSRHKPSVSYARNTVTFQFARKLDTTKASFKLDAGTARSWTEVYPQLVQTGTPLDGRSLDNPTDGKVMLPVSVLTGVHSVTIRPTPTRSPKQFTLDGLTDALASARALGCDPVNDFVSQDRVR